MEVAGTEGDGFVNAGSGVRLTGKTNWEYTGEKNNPYQTQHDELFASIRKGKPMNDGQLMANSTMLSSALISNRVRPRFCISWGYLSRSTTASPIAAVPITESQASSLGMPATSIRPARRADDDCLWDIRRPTSSIFTMRATTP